MAFNDLVSPKAKTELFKIYADVSTTTTASYELQGRGITEWNVEQNQEINKETDVLGLVDMNRGVAQPVQSGVQLKLRKGSALAEILFDAFYTGNYAKLDDIDILQKFEFVDATATGSCKARLAKHCVIKLNSFVGEADNYLYFDIDINYTNEFVFGSMTKVDASPVVFTPDTTVSEG